MTNATFTFAFNERAVLSAITNGFIYVYNIINLRKRVSVWKFFIVILNITLHVYLIITYYTALCI